MVSKKRLVGINGYMQNWIKSYYDSFTYSDDLSAGKWIKKLYKYILEGLEKDLFVDDERKAENAIEWIEEHSFHVEGPLAPSRIKLELWQKAMVACLFGICDIESGERQFREVLFVVGRKNGKSLLAAAIANYVFRKEGGYGCRVYNMAPKLEQADIIYNNTWAMIQLDPEQQEIKEAISEKREKTHRKVEDGSLVKKRMSDLFVPDTNSTMKKISSNAKKSDGFNPSLCICDEIASWEGEKGLRAYEVMKSGMGARPEAILLSCTTAGYVSDSIYDELMKRATRFLQGDSEETRLLPFIYMSDDIEKWDTYEELQKSNPNLGVSVRWEYLQEEIAIAKSSLSKKAEFLTKYNCIKQNSSLAWLSAQDVMGVIGEPLDIENYKHCYCVGGLDLSQTTDLTCACVVIEKEGKLYVFAHFWLPAEKIDEAIERDGVPYNIYLQRGLLSLSGDNYVDYHDCYDWFVNLVEQYEILPLKIGYDRYSAQYLVQDLDAYGFQMDDVYQGWNLWSVLQEMEGMIKDRKICIGDNDLLKVHLLNSAIKMNNERGKGQLVKLTPTTRIDGTAALSDALCVRQKWFAEIGSQLANR